MKLEKIVENHRYLYVEQCPCCALKQEILTQDDDFPEYHTEIYLKCQCGEFIEFILPVN